MVKDWDLHKDEIEELYMHKDNKLGFVMTLMLRKHGFKASERAYKMKLDDWGMRKYRSRPKKKTITPPPTILENENVVVQLPSPPQPESTTSARPQIQQQLPPISILATDPFANREYTWNPHPKRNFNQHQPSTLTSTLSLPISRHSHNPVANSSLIFFFARPPTESLNMLRTHPNMAPRALETLLRNWSNESHLQNLYLSHANHFLSKREFCHTIMSVNWTRWTDTDETLFGLVDEIEDVKSRKVLVRGLLEADLRFLCPLEKRNATWALEWRAACEEVEWKVVNRILMNLDVSRELRMGAYEVLANHFLERLKAQIMWLCESQGGTVVGVDKAGLPCDDSKEEYLAIVRSCRRRGVVVGSGWFRSRLGLLSD